MQSWPEVAGIINDKLWSQKMCKCRLYTFKYITEYRNYVYQCLYAMSTHIYNLSNIKYFPDIFSCKIFQKSEKRAPGNATLDPPPIT